MEESKKIKEMMEQYMLKDDELQVWKAMEGDDSAYLARFLTKSCIVTVEMSVIEKAHVIRIEASAGLVVPPERRTEASRYIANVNHELTTGHFSITSCCCTELVYLVTALYDDTTLPSLEIYRCMMSQAIHIVEAEYPNLVGVLWPHSRIKGAFAKNTTCPPLSIVDKSVAKLLGNRPLGIDGQTDSLQPDQPKRRGRPRKVAPEATNLSSSAKESSLEEQLVDCSHQEATPPTEKRKRGRPRIHPLPLVTQVKRPVGRPRKRPLEQ